MTQRGLLQRLLLVAVAVGMAMAVSQPGRASESLRPSLKQIAAAVAKIAQSRGDASVNVGQFTGPPAFNSNAGPGIQKILTDELANQGVQIRRFNAALGVRGEYLYTSAAATPDSAFQQIRLKVVLTDGSGQPLTALNRDVDVGGAESVSPIGPRSGGATLPVRRGEIDLDTFTGGAEAAALLGVTYDFERLGLGFDVTKDVVRESFQQPTAVIVGGTAVRSSPTSPYFVEVFVGNRPLPIRLEEGQPMVDLRKGQTFFLRITNRARHDISTALTLDGVSSFAFSRELGADGNPLQRYVILKNNFQLIKGWHETFASIKQFQVGAFESAPGPNQSPAAQFGTESSLGMITVVIRGSWLGNESPPADEPSQQLVESAAPPEVTAPRAAAVEPAFPDEVAAAPGAAPDLPASGAFEAAAPDAPVVSRTAGHGAFDGVLPGSGVVDTSSTPRGAANEPGAPAPKASAAERLAIIRGNEVTQASQAASGRNAGVVRAIITLRYDK